MQKTLTQSMTQLPLGADWTIIRQHRSLGTAERIESDLLNTFNVRMRRQDTSDAQLQLDKEIAKMKEIENYRTALLWNLFMSAPEVQTAKMKLGFK